MEKRVINVISSAITLTLTLEVIDLEGVEVLVQSFAESLHHA